MKTHLQNPDKNGKTFCGRGVGSIRIHKGNPLTDNWGLCENCASNWISSERKALRMCHLRFPEGEFDSFDDHSITGVNAIFAIRELNVITQGEPVKYFKANIKPFYIAVERTTTKIDIVADEDFFEVREYSMGVCLTWMEGVRSRGEFASSILNEIIHNKHLASCQDFQDLITEFTNEPEKEDDV